MGTIVGPSYFDSNAETGVGTFGWASFNLALQETGFAYTDALTSNDETTHLSFYDWADRASVPTNAIIDEITFEISVQSEKTLPDYRGILQPQGGSWATPEWSLTDIHDYSRTATELGLTNEERLTAIHSTDPNDAVDFEVDILAWNGSSGTGRIYYLRMTVEWSPGSGGGILLAK